MYKLDSLYSKTKNIWKSKHFTSQEFSMKYSQPVLFIIILLMVLWKNKTPPTIEVKRFREINYRMDHK